MNTKRGYPTFGPDPAVNSQNFDFCEELKWLPFTLNLEEAHLGKQLSRFLIIIYLNKDIFLLKIWMIFDQKEWSVYSQKSYNWVTLNMKL